MSSHTQLTTPAPVIPGVAPLAALVSEALGHWLTVARQVESGDLLLWSPELEQLTDRLERMTRHRALVEGLGMQQELESEVKRLRDAWITECLACIVDAIHEDPLLIFS